MRRNCNSWALRRLSPISSARKRAARFQTELTASAMLAPHKGFQPIRPHSRPIPSFSRRQACYRCNRLLKGFQETDEIPDLVRIQPELRHAWMTRRHPFGERVFERFHRILLVKGPKWRRRGARASAGPFNRMTVRTLGYRNGLAAANALFVGRRRDGRSDA